MAITLDRMVALVNAATDFYEAHRKVVAKAANIQQEVLEHKLPKDAAYDYLSLIISPNNTDLFRDFTKSVTTIIIEQHNYDPMTIRRALKERQRQEAKRQAEGRQRKYRIRNPHMFETTEISYTRVNPIMNEVASTPAPKTQIVKSYHPAEVQAMYETNHENLDYIDTKKCMLECGPGDTCLFYTQAIQEHWCCPSNRSDEPGTPFAKQTKSFELWPDRED
jgi:hypothetical protein